MAVLSHSCASLKSSITPPQPYTSEIVFVDFDALKNVFKVRANGELIKLNQKGDTLATFADVRYGTINTVDVFNPQKILIFYQKYNKAVLLDQSLSSVREFELESLGLWNQSAVGLSQDLNLWVFDVPTQILRKISSSGEELLSSDPIRFHLRQAFNPLRIIERNNIVYLSQPDWGWIRIDPFGQFIDALPQKHDWFFIKDGGQILFLNGDILMSWQPGIGIPEILSNDIKNLNDLDEYLRIDSATVNQ